MKEVIEVREAIGKYVRNNLSMIIGSGELKDVDIQHIIDIACSIVYTRDNIMQGGSFVKAIIDDKLSRAVSYADTTCIRALKLFINVRDFVHFDL